MTILSVQHTVSSFSLCGGVSSGQVLVTGVLGDVRYAEFPGADIQAPQENLAPSAHRKSGAVSGVFCMILPFFLI